jgi:hypothetical protein
MPGEEHAHLALQHEEGVSSMTSDMGPIGERQALANGASGQASIQQ